MSFFARLFGFGTKRREAPGAAPLAPPPAPDHAPHPADPPAGLTHEKGEAGNRLSRFTVADALRALGCNDPDGWADVLAPAMARHGITTPGRIAAFLANVAHETGKFRSLVESMNYAAGSLVPVFGMHRISHEQAHALGRKPGEGALPEGRQKAIALIVYGGEWGRKNLGNRPGTDDAWVFRGHGLMQLTGRANFERFGKVIGRKADDLPALLRTREGAADSAAHFFAASGCNAAADIGDIARVRKIINGGALGLAEVREGYATVLARLAGRI